MFGPIKKSIPLPNSLTVFNAMTSAVDYMPVSSERKNQINEYINANGPALLNTTSFGLRVGAKIPYRYVKDKVTKMSLGAVSGAVIGGPIGCFTAGLGYNYGTQLLLGVTQSHIIHTLTGIALGIGTSLVPIAVGTFTGMGIGYKLSEGIIETAAQVMLEELNLETQKNLQLSSLEIEAD